MFSQLAIFIKNFSLNNLHFVAYAKLILKTTNRERFSRIYSITLIVDKYLNFSPLKENFKIEQFFKST